MDSLIEFYNKYYILVWYLAFVNLVTFFLYLTDKLYAASHSWRIRERTLLIFALCGGTLGAIMSIKFFRHKTKKDAFLIWLALIGLFQIIFILYLPTILSYFGY